MSGNVHGTRAQDAAAPASFNSEKPKPHFITRIQQVAFDRIALVVAVFLVAAVAVAVFMEVIVLTPLVALITVVAVGILIGIDAYRRPTATEKKMPSSAHDAEKGRSRASSTASEEKSHEEIPHPANPAGTPSATSTEEKKPPVAPNPNLILVELDGGLSLFMDRKENGLFKEFDTDERSVKIDCQKVGINPQIMFRLLVAIQEKATGLSLSEFLSQEQMSHLDPKLNDLGVFFAQNKSISYLSEKFGVNKSIEMLLEMHTAVDYLGIDSVPILSLIDPKSGSKNQKLSDDFLINLFMAVVGDPRFLSLQRNLQIEILSRRYHSEAFDKRIKTHESLKPLLVPPFNKKGLPQMTEEEKVIHTLRSIKDLDDKTFEVLLTYFQSHGIPKGFTMGDFQDCIALGKASVRRALSLAAALDRPEAIDLLLFSPWGRARQILVFGKYGLLDALAKAAANNSMRSLEKISKLPKVAKILAVPVEGFLDWKAYILFFAAKGGHLQAMDMAVGWLGDQQLSIKCIAEIIEAAAGGGHIEAMDKGIELLKGQDLSEEYIAPILEAAARGGHIEATDKAIELLKGQGLSDEDIVPTLLEAAAGGGHIEAMDKAIELFKLSTKHACIVFNIADRTIAAAAGGGHIEAMDKAIQLLKGIEDVLVKEGIPFPGRDALLAAAQGGHIEAMDKAIELLKGQDLSINMNMGRDIIDIIEAAAEGGHIEAMDKGIELLKGQDLSISDVTIILKGAISSGYIKAIDKSIKLLKGRKLSIEQATRVLAAAAEFDRIGAMSKCIKLLAGRKPSRVDMERALNDAIINSSVDCLEKLREVVSPEKSWQGFLEGYALGQLELERPLIMDPLVQELIGIENLGT